MQSQLYTRADKTDWSESWINRAKKGVINKEDMSLTLAYY